MKTYSPFHHSLFGFACILFLSGSILTADQSQRVSLFLQADRQAEVFFRESLEWVQTHSPQPAASQPDATAHWMEVSVTDTYIGYIESPLVAKDLTVPPGTPIRVRPEANAPVLAVSSATIQPEVVEDARDWVTVEFHGPVQLYYFTEVAAPQPALAPAPAPVPMIRAEDVAQPVPPPPPLEVLEEVDAVATPLPFYPAIPGGQLEAQVSREFSGTLRRNTGFRRWVSPNYPYFLESPDGQVMAYVELDDALVIGRVERFFDRPVILTGTTQALQGRSTFLIRTRFIREP